MKSDKPIEQVLPPIPRNDWRDKYAKPEEIKSYKLEDSSDDSTLNRMVQLKTFDNTDIVEGKPGKLYFDKANKKVKIFIDGQWVDVVTNPVP